MAMCEICGKGNMYGRRISINRSQVSRRAKRKWKPNIRSVKAIVEGTPKTVKACAGCIRAGKVTRAV